MGVFKKLLCGMLSKQNPNNPRLIINNKVYKIAMTKMINYSNKLLTMTVANVLFGLTVINIAFPGLLSRWYNGMYRRGRAANLPRLIIPPVILICTWMPFQYFLEVVLTKCLLAAYPNMLPSFDVVTLILSFLVFLYSIVFPYNATRPVTIVDDASESSQQSLKGRRTLRDPYKRTRSGLIYGRYEGRGPNRYN